MEGVNLREYGQGVRKVTHPVTFWGGHKVNPMPPGRLTWSSLLSLANNLSVFLNRVSHKNQLGKTGTPGSALALMEHTQPSQMGGSTNLSLPEPTTSMTLSMYQGRGLLSCKIYKTDFIFSTKPKGMEVSVSDQRHSILW